MSENTCYLEAKTELQTWYTNYCQRKIQQKKKTLNPRAMSCVHYTIGRLTFLLFLERAFQNT